MNIHSRIVHLNFIPKNISIDNIQITYRHLNKTNQIPICVYLNNNIQWNTDGCQLLSTNLTHSICSCNHFNTFALFMNIQKVFLKKNYYRIFLFKF